MTWNKYKEALLGTLAAFSFLITAAALILSFIFLITYTVWASVVFILFMLFVLYPVLIAKDIL